jgi:Zn-dependent protease with chaperone function
MFHEVGMARLFGISFIFMFVGGIFSLSTANHHKSIKYMAIMMPFLFLFIDVASWWLTKFSPHFAWLVKIKLIPNRRAIPTS